MICDKCGKPILENMDYCLDCKISENPSYIEYQENQESNQVNGELTTELVNTSTDIVQCQCGQYLNLNWESCPQCNIPINVEISPSKKNNSKLYIIIFLVSFALGFFLKIKYYDIFYLVALITIITGKINCPKNDVIEALFWVMIAFLIYWSTTAMLQAACNYGIGIITCVG